MSSGKANQPLGAHPPAAPTIPSSLMDANNTPTPKVLGTPEARAHVDTASALNNAQDALSRLNTRIAHGSLSLPRDVRAKVSKCINALEDAIQKEKDPEKAKKLAETLEKFCEQKIMGGPGSTTSQAFDAALKGLASQNPLLGLVLALLFFAIKKGMQSHSIKGLEKAFEKLPPEMRVGSKEEKALNNATAEFANITELENNFKKELADVDVGTAKIGEARAAEILATPSVMTGEELTAVTEKMAATDGANLISAAKAFDKVAGNEAFSFELMKEKTPAQNRSPGSEALSSSTNGAAPPPAAAATAGGASASTPSGAPPPSA